MAVRMRPQIRYSTGPESGPRRLASIERPTLDGESQDVLIGRHLHEVIAAVCEAGHTGPALRERVRDACAELVRREHGGWHARSIALRIEGYTQVYFAFFAPPADWRYLGSEIPVTAGIVDLGWESARGEVLYDELKSGGYRAPVIDTRNREQVERYRRDGIERYGRRFKGVRLLLLGAPFASRVLLPSGELVPITDTPYRFGAQDSR